MEPDYRIISHTADIGLAVRGKTLSALFENAALGMTSLLAEPGSFQPSLKATFNLTANTPEMLLVDWPFYRHWAPAGFGEFLVVGITLGLIYREK